MYKNNISRGPKRFGRASHFSAKSRFNGGRFSRPKNKKRSRGERIDFSRFIKKGQLWFKSHRSPKLNGPMAFYKANSFAIKWEYKDMNADAFAMFTLDEKGKAQSIKMKGISPNIDFSFDFQDLDLRRVNNN